MPLSPHPLIQSARHQLASAPLSNLAHHPAAADLAASVDFARRAGERSIRLHEEFQLDLDEARLLLRARRLLARQAGEMARKFGAR
jgi:hypothetical protein